MELHQLRYFVAVADEGSFTRAAEACLVAQPSLSQQIIKLEKELGTPLFERLGRRIQLTDAGRMLYERAVVVLETVERFPDELQQADAAGRGRVTVGAILTVAPYLLPSWLRRFRRRCPEAEVVVHEDLTARIVEELVRGKLDVGVLALPIDQPALHLEPLMDDELLLAMPAGHALANKSRVTMKDMVREPFILIDPVHCLGEQVLAFCLERDCRPRVVCRSSQILTVQEMIALGHGVSLLPACAAVADRSNKRCYRSLAGKRPARSLVLAWHKDRYQSPVVQSFIEVAKAETAGADAPSARRLRDRSARGSAT